MRMRVVAVVLAMLLLAGCSSSSSWQAKPEQHIVRKGETLHSIAWRYGKDPADVARWNRLGDGSLIYPGQVIRLTPPGGASPQSSASQAGFLNLDEPLNSVP